MQLKRLRMWQSSVLTYDGVTCCNAVPDHFSCFQWYRFWNLHPPAALKSCPCPPLRLNLPVNLRLPCHRVQSWRLYAIAPVRRGLPLMPRSPRFFPKFFMAACHFRLRVSKPMFRQSRCVQFLSLKDFCWIDLKKKKKKFETLFQAHLVLFDAS